MTNTEIIQAIRNDIINRIDKRHLSAQAKNELVSVLSFLSTLESKTPMNLEGLEEEIERIVKCEKEFMNFQFKSQLIGYIARHFAQWGTEHAREQMMKDAVPFYEILKVVPPGPERDKVKLIICKED